MKIEKYQCVGNEWYLDWVKLTHLPHVKHHNYI